MAVEYQRIRSRGYCGRTVDGPAMEQPSAAFRGGAKGPVLGRRGDAQQLCEVSTVSFNGRESRLVDRDNGSTSDLADPAWSTWSRRRRSRSLPALMIRLPAGISGSPVESAGWCVRLCSDLGSVGGREPHEGIRGASGKLGRLAALERIPAGQLALTGHTPDSLQAYALRGVQVRHAVSACSARKGV